MALAGVKYLTAGNFDMGLFDRLGALTEARAKLLSTGPDPFGVVFDEISSPVEGIAGGRPMVLLGTNNYLGFTFNSACVRAATEATRKWGTGTTGSRIANGTYGGHAELERELSEFLGVSDTVVFSTGFQANLGVLSTVAGRDDVLLIDGDSHASIYDGCALGAAKVVRFRHNCPVDLDKRLARLGTHRGNKVIVVEGIYSMLGDRAPLKEIAEVKKRHGAFLVVDEAHSFGVLGSTGRGLSQEERCEADVDIIVGTFSKSMGAVGGFASSSLSDFSLMRVASRPYMFSASLPPATIATVRSALAELRSQPLVMHKLWQNIDTLYGALSAAGFKLGPSRSPIVAIRFKDRDTAIDLWQRVFESGYYVNLALPPATPNSESLLRCSVSAAHSSRQLTDFVDAIAQCRGDQQRSGVEPTRAA